MSSPTRKITPTAIAKASNCLHSWYLECYGDTSQKVELAEGVKLLFERGREYEAERVAELENCQKPEWDGRNLEEGHRKTKELMISGAPWIYQGVLISDQLLGYPDLLQRIEGHSKVGPYTYRPVDIKGHKAVTKKDRLQLLAYARMLELVLGHQVPEGGIWLNTGDIETVDLDRHGPEFDDIVAAMLQIRDEAAATNNFRCGECGMCVWQLYCSEDWKAGRNISLIYGVTGKTAQKYFEKGYRTYLDVAGSSEEEIAARVGIKNPERARITFLLARAWAEGRPVLIRPVSFPTDLPIHFWDIETYEDVTYLHGNIRLHNGAREEKLFFAEDPSQEREVWHQYLDYLARDSEALVYNWADYERGFAVSLWDRYGGNPNGYRHLRDSMVDQCAFVREHFALPVSSYSIKKVAPFFGFSWDAEDAGGLNSEAWYGEWLDTRNPDIRAKILRYNLDDVVAMEVIDRELRRFANTE